MVTPDMIMRRLLSIGKMSMSEDNERFRYVINEEYWCEERDWESFIMTSLEIYYYHDARTTSG